MLAEQFQAFFARTDTFGLGVCNGCQMFAELADIIPGAQDWPRFTTNRSERFEARLSMVEVLESPSLFFQGMAGSRLPIAVAHGEGYANFAYRGNADKAIAAMRFVDNHGRGHRGLSVQPERQRRRSDRGDHRRRPLHGHDAAPGARVPQHPDELDLAATRAASARGCSCGAMRASGWASRSGASSGEAGIDGIRPGTG